MTSVLKLALKEREYDVVVCTEAREGYKRAAEENFDCIVCNPDLPDIDGLWLVRRIRTENGPISRVPILFVGEVPEQDLRVQAFHVGVDAFLRSPVTNDEIVAQIDALLALSRRLGGSPSVPPLSMSAFAALRGDLSSFPLASILMMLELERRSGTVDVVATSGKRAALTITEGLFANTEIDGATKSAIEVLREVLSWRAGFFAYLPKESATLPAPRASVGAIVLEAMRLEDEKKGA